MKKLAITLLWCLAPITSYAQNTPGMSEADMQNMMQQMQKAQACMEKIDQKQLEALENKADQFEAEMKSLCANGKRDEAQKKAMVYMKEIVNSSAVKEAKRCGEMMTGAMHGMMQDMTLVEQDKDFTHQHVCDTY
jgi:predicted transcriptional regulator